MSNCWRPIIDEEQCEDCGGPGGEYHAPGCPVGEDIIREINIEERADMRRREARE